MITISEREIFIDFNYILNFADGIKDIIVTNDPYIIDFKLNINLYIPMEVSLASAQDAIRSIKEKQNAESSEV